MATLGPARRRLPQRSSIIGVRIPAPVGGLNTVDDGDSMPPTDASLCYNLVGAEYGMRARLGTREWATGLGAAVRHTICYTGGRGDAVQDRIFAVTKNGIYDCTTKGTTAPTQMVGGGSGVGWASTVNAGFGVSHTVVRASDGQHYCFYADEDNGLYLYDPTGNVGAGAWSKVTNVQITGVDPANVVFVTVWKHRVWLVERNTANAWYLDLDSIYGAATKFTFAGKFRSGGHLVGLWNWTYDGGAGLDDALVAVSAGGDVAIYQGQDPSIYGGFQLRGVWSVGGVPAGRGIASSFGGDLALVSSTGVVPMSRLVTGALLLDSTQYATHKISNAFNLDALTAGTNLGWSVHIQPQDNVLLVSVPSQGTDAQQSLYAMSLVSKGWTKYRDIPYASGGSLRSRFFVGTTDGRILLNDGYVDGVSLTDASFARPVQFAVTTAFKTMGAPTQKQIRLIRPLVISQGTTDYVAAARYDFDLTELNDVTIANPGGSVWAGTDDVVPVWQDDGATQVGGAQWVGDYVSKAKVFAGRGIGSAFAVTLKGAATARTVLTGFDVTLVQGGFL